MGLLYKWWHGVGAGQISAGRGGKLMRQRERERERKLVWIPTPHAPCIADSWERSSSQCHEALSSPGVDVARSRRELALGSGYRLTAGDQNFPEGCTDLCVCPIMKGYTDLTCVCWRVVRDCPGQMGPSSRTQVSRQGAWSLGTWDVSPKVTPYQSGRGEV